MSDGPQPMNPHLKKVIDAQREGTFNSPGAADVPRDAVSQIAYEQGKRARDQAASAPRQTEQTLGEAIHMAWGLAGGAAGLLYGASLVGADEATWTTAFGLGALGLVGGFAIWSAIVGSVRRLRKTLLWRRGRDERDAARLAGMWEARFASPITQELLSEVSEDGRGWVMDSRGNFHLRMKSGKEFFVGTVGDTLKTEASGRGGTALEDAYQFVLIHESLGKERIRVDEGSKNRRRALWVAASLAGMEVADYTPDGKAVSMLEKERRERGDSSKPSQEGDHA